MIQIGEDINVYVEAVSAYDRYIENVKPSVYFLGLGGEVGELCEALDDVNAIDNNEKEWRKHVLAELGDVMWYWFGLSRNLKLDWNRIWELVDSETYSRQSFHERNKNNNTAILKIVACTGRLLEHRKKSHRDDGGKITNERLDKIEQKLAEMLEHIFAFCVSVGITPTEVLQNNYDKLFARNEAGTLQGEGDGITKEERT